MVQKVNWRSYIEITKRRYIMHYLAYVQQNTNNYPALENELENIVNATNKASEQDDHKTILEMERWLWSGGAFLDLRGHISEGWDLIIKAVKAAHSLGQTFQEGRLLGQLGRISLTLEITNLSRGTKNPLEYFEQALEIARAINDLQGEASHLGCLGQVYLERGDKRKAVECLQKARKLAVEIGDRQMEGRILGSLGSVELADHTVPATKTAIGYFEGAVVIAREIGDRQGEASHLGSLGRAYEVIARIRPSTLDFIRPFQWGSPYSGEDAERYARYQRGGEPSDYQQAMEYYQQALAVAREISDQQLQDRLQSELARVRSL